VAATQAKAQFGLNRILIVDWDVHHGNGTQHLFEEDPSVLYFSVHRYDNGDFFPGSKDAAPQAVGRGAGKGFNVNVAWNLAWKDNVGMGDDEYLAAWQLILLPVALDFNPELILVSAGFDSAAGDVGGCSVTPAGFAQMTRMLQSVSPNIVLVLEGGYEPAVIAECTCACVRALLGDPLDLRTEVRPKKEACLSLERTLRSHGPFWASLASSECASSASIAPVIMLDVVGIGHTPPAEGAGNERQHEHSSDSHIQSKTVRARRRKKVDRAATGVSISTRNAAESNWKGDTKKLARRERQLGATLERIEALKRDLQGGKRMSRKECASLEEEDNLKWELEEVQAELAELTSLSRDDAIRMYAGCR